MRTTGRCEPRGIPNARFYIVPKKANREDIPKWVMSHVEKLDFFSGSSPRLTVRTINYGIRMIGPEEVLVEYEEGSKEAGLLLHSQIEFARHYKVVERKIPTRHNATDDQADICGNV